MTSASFADTPQQLALEVKNDSASHSSSSFSDDDKLEMDADEPERECKEYGGLGAMAGEQMPRFPENLGRRYAGDGGSARNTVGIVLKRCM